MKMTYWIAIGVAVVVLVVAALMWGRYHPDPDVIGRLTIDKNFLFCRGSI